jgi:hypothetical protein
MKNIIKGDVIIHYTNGNINNGYMFEFKFETAKIIRDIYNKPFPDLC